MSAPYYTDDFVTLYQGDCRDVLAQLPAGSVQTCVTSPPYFGLRDYGHDKQIGLEPTPDAYVAALVAVFREVRRGLRDDGTVWLNLGDSYAGPRGGDQGANGEMANRSVAAARCRVRNETLTAGDLPHKNLIGIPWRVAFALQQPYYTGTIRDERDRIWLAAMLDAEGCMFIHKRKAGQHNGQGYHRVNDSYSPGVEISNTSRALVERVAALVGKGSICEQESGRFGRKQTLYRWNLRTIESRDFVREMYPYLVAKQRQARILIGCPSSGERAEAAHAALKNLHQGVEADVDFPAPPSMYEPGWYLRSDVIWSKCNPMPESVTDRPTKAHEYVFLLSKRPTYFYDAAAISEDVAEASIDRLTQASLTVQLGSFRANGGTRTDRPMKAVGTTETRNARTVWEIATQPYKGAHFATMPRDLARRCILAGSRPGDVVLDPFGGAGTTAFVAKEHNRRAVLIEASADYCALIPPRIRQHVLDFGGAA